MDLDLKLFEKGKLQTEDNTDLPEPDYTAVGQQSSSFAIQSVHDLPKRHSDQEGHGAVPLSRVYRDPLDLRRCRKLAPHDALLAARRREHARRRLLETRTDE